MADTATEAPLPSCPSGEHCGLVDEVQQLRVENAQLAGQLRTDTLTGLFNFRYFRDSLALEMERTRRSETPTGLIMIDLDHFKQVNDQWGHEVGNQVLAWTAENLRGSVRQLDIACRYGGEEFAVILPTCDLLSAIRVAQRLCEALAEQPVPLENGSSLAVTASLGVALFKALDGDTPEQFVQRADAYLYQAKQQGRNRVCHSVEDAEKSDVTVSQDERDALSSFFGDTVDDG